MVDDHAALGENVLARAPLRIALTSPYDAAFPGGVTHHVRALAAQLRARGHRVDIIAPASETLPAAEGVVALPTRVYALPMSGATARVSIEPRVWGAVGQILRARQYDIVHAHEPTAPPLSLAVLHHARAPLVGTFHQYRLRHPYNEMMQGLTRLFVERLSARIAVSRAAYESAAPYFPGEYHIIPNGVQCALFRAARPFPQVRDGEHLNLLYVGRLESRKGLRYLLRAFAQVRAAEPRARLWVVGAYARAERGLFVRWLRQHRVRGVRFVGQVSEADKARWYKSADLFCAPSTGYESFGMVLIEAMAAGVAVAASDIAGYREVIQHGETGALVPARDSKQLAATLLALLRAPEERARLAAAGARAAAQYDWGRVAARIEALYYQVAR